jgi:hypothetical protein
MWIWLQKQRHCCCCYTFRLFIHPSPDRHAVYMQRILNAVAPTQHAVYSWLSIGVCAQCKTAFQCVLFNCWRHKTVQMTADRCLSTTAAARHYVCTTTRVVTFLILSLLMSYICGAPCKARNFNVVYIWTYVWQRWKPSLFICCTMFQHWIGAESFPVSLLCVNTLLATKVTLMTTGI